MDRALRKGLLVVGVVALTLSVVTTTGADAAVPSARATVAVHVSEYTEAVWPYSSWHYYDSYRFVEEALRSDGTPFVEVSDSEIESGQLLNPTGPRYPILISLANEAISDTEAGQIRQYVRRGGHAYVGSSSWTKNSDGSLRTDGDRPAFALASEMGLAATGWTDLSHVIRTGDSTMVDQLDQNVAYMWWMPRSYNTIDLSEPSPHFVWSAQPAGLNPASVILSRSAAKGFNEPVVWGAFETGEHPYSWTRWSSDYDLGLADVDGDGRDDLIGINSAGDIAVGLSTGQSFGSPTSWGTWNTSYDFNLADVNGDDHYDIVGRGATGDIQVATSDIDESNFNALTSWGTWDSAYDFQLADVNGDQYDDIVGRSSTGDVQVATADIDESNFNGPTGWGSWDSSYDLHLADVNGDGYSDLVGRAADSGVQAALSNGSSFGTATSWQSWDSDYELNLADPNGDGAADMIGRDSTGDTQVARSDGTTFTPSTSWATWNSSYDFHVADVNGDGRDDLIGRDSDGYVEVGLSTGNAEEETADQSTGDAVLAEKEFGSGKFIYNAELVPLAGYGGFASDSSEYKTLRVSIEDAFSANGLPLVRQSAWPYPSPRASAPYSAALIYRHDHWLSLDVAAIEQSYGVQGEYYIQPDNYCSAEGVCESSGCDGAVCTDYFWGAGDAVTTYDSIIGAHVTDHKNLDAMDDTAAVSRLAATASQIQSDTGGLMEPVFVAPGYLAIRGDSLRAIWDAGFRTAGEQGAGPYPHFAFDPDVSPTAEDQYIGEGLLELPISEWPGPLDNGTERMHDNLDHMVLTDGTPNTEVIQNAVDLAYDSGGLINLYDHVGDDGYPGLRTQLAEEYLSYATTKSNVWRTTSQDIRNWWLLRDSRTISTAVERSGSEVRIRVATRQRAPRAATTSSARNLGLSITLNGELRRMAHQRLRAETDDGESLQTRVADGELHVRIGSAQSVLIRLG